MDILFHIVMWPVLGIFGFHLMIWLIIGVMKDKNFTEYYNNEYTEKYTPKQIMFSAAFTGYLIFGISILVLFLVILIKVLDRV
ncbi:MAG: hypothetical protein R3230_00285 [Nitrosopumilaceae archaeon]|nr:hypothetical protein [Nitrosopumilaceae archaeon]